MGQMSHIEHDSLEEIDRRWKFWSQSFLEATRAWQARYKIWRDLFV